MHAKKPAWEEVHGQLQSIAKRRAILDADEAVWLVQAEAMRIWTKLGYGPGSLDVPITFRGYLLSPGGAEKGVMITTLCLVKAIKTGKAEAGKKVDMTVHVVANYYQHVVEGNTVDEIDVFNKVTMNGGVDKSASARRILGFTY